MSQLSKHKYLSVMTHVPISYEYHHIRLPDEWDTMTDAARNTYIKQEAFEDWQSFRANDCDMGGDDRRWWQEATVNDLEGWCVWTEGTNSSTPLAEVITEPQAFLELKGLYVRNSSVDEYDDEEYVDD